MESKKNYSIISNDFYNSDLFLSIFTSKNHGKLFLYLYGKAAYSDYTDKKGRFIKRGQLVVSVRGLSKDINLSKQKVITALNKLEKEKEIKRIRQQNTKLNYTLIEIIRYEELRCYVGKSKGDNKRQPQKQSNNTSYNLEEYESKSLFD